jgi:hypothetical protein
VGCSRPKCPSPASPQARANLINRRGNISNTTGSKVVSELTQLLQIALYIYICLAALLFYTASVAGPSSVAFVHLGYAAVKALVLAKFILLGHWLLGEGRSKQLVIYSVLYQALAIWGLLVVLSLLEQFVEGLIHGYSFAAGLAEVQWNSLVRLLAQSLILFFVLLPYVALRQLAAILGSGKLKQIFFSAHG